MPLGDTLPPPNRTVGMAGHVADTNAIITELAATQQTLLNLIANGFSIKGTVANVGALPSFGNTGDHYFVGNDGDLYGWFIQAPATTPAWHLVGNLKGEAGGKGTTVITVAASNSPALIRQRSDYVCTGMNDDVTINAALTDAANQMGGTGSRNVTVQLADGDYSLISSVLIPNRGITFTGSSYLTRLFRQGSGFVLTAGSGAGGALIKLAATEESRSTQMATICNMTLDGGTHTSGVSGIIWDTDGVVPVYPEGTYGHPNTDPDSYNTFCDLYIRNVQNGILIRGVSSQPRHNYIRRVTVREFNQVGIGGSNSSDNVITECFVQSGRGNGAIGIQTPGGSTTISNCKVAYCSVAGSTGGIGMVVSSSRAMVTSCESQDNPYGIDINGAQAMVTDFKVDTQVAGCIRGVFIGGNNCKFDGVIQTRGSGTYDRGLEFGSASHDHYVTCQIIKPGVTKTVSINNGAEITADSGLPGGVHLIRVTGIRTLNRLGTTSTEPPPPPAGTLGYVGGDTVAFSASTNSMTLSLPGAKQAGDFAVMSVVYDLSAGAPTTPSGWTLVATQNKSSTMEARLYTKVLTDTDPNPVITGMTVANRISGSVQVFRGVSGLDTVSPNPAASVVSTAATTHTAPSIDPVNSSVVVAFIHERSSTPSTAVTTPTNLTAAGSAFGVGNGSCSSAAGYNITPGTAVFTPGAWVLETSTANIIMFTVALDVA